ncbi:MAG: ribonuclease HII [Actinophytocola sp.]|nr:ribonuclease HII [Actinophytocola sp.]
MTATAVRPGRVPIRHDAGSWGLQGALDRRGLGPVAGVDEAGRGACAGPLVVAACVLRPGDSVRFADLTDSKLLTPVTRERIYDQVLARAVTFAVVVIPPDEVDADGVHAANVAGMRRAVARLDCHPGYVLTDGFRIPGLTAPNVPVRKGDQVVACVAAASVLAKVTRDRIMVDLHDQFPMYGFDVHKGYSTGEHTAALTAHGPCDMHRWSFANVAIAGRNHGVTVARRVTRSAASVRAVAAGPLRAAEGVVSQNGRIVDATADLQAGGTPAR